MSITYTENYKLSMDSADNAYSVERVNANMQKIDTALKANADAASKAQKSADAITTAKGQPEGFAGLDEYGVVPAAQLPTENLFELIEIIEITDSDALATISRTQTPEGKPYDFEKMLVAVSIPATATAHSPYMSAIDAVSNFISFTTSATTAYLHQFLFEIKNGRAFGERVSSGTEANPVQKYATIRSMGKYEVQALTRLYFYSGNAEINFPTGTKIDIYGVWR